MDCALMLDLEGGRTVPADRPILGRALAAYPLMAAKAARSLKRIYLMSATQEVKAVGLQHDAVIVDPPPGPETPVGSVSHGLAAITADLKGEEPLEILVILSANAPAITASAIEEGLSALHSRPELDSAVTVCADDPRSPGFSLKRGPDGLIEPAAPGAPFAGALFPDWGAFIARARAVAALEGPSGLPWIGRKVLPILQEGSGLVIHEWQIPRAEWWLKNRGATDAAAFLEPKPQPKPQPASRPERW